MIKREINVVDTRTPIANHRVNLLDVISEVIDSGAFVGSVGNPFVNALEKNLSEYLGGVGVCVCNSGTTALMVALLAAGVSPGDEVILPDFNFIAGVEATVLLGGRPVLVDVIEDTGIIDFEEVVTAVSSKTAAVIVTDLYGQFPDYARLLEMLGGDVVVIEDGAQSFGAADGETRACACGHIATTSFYPVKPLGAFGEGGAVFSHTAEFINRARLIINHGDVGKYNHVGLGFNGRLDALQAAIVNYKLTTFFPWELSRRRAIANRYLSEISEEVTPRVINSHPAWAQFTLRVPDRARFITALGAAGIGTAIHYPKPISKQAIYGSVAENNVMANFLANHVVSIPVHPYLSDDDVMHIIETINRYLEEFACVV